MVFPVVIYGCDSWTIKKAEHWRIDLFELWCWRRLFRIPWMVRRSNIHWKDWCWKWSTSTLAHLMWRTNSLEKILMLGKTEGRRRGAQPRMRCLDGITDSMNMSLSKLRVIVKDREALFAAVLGVAKESDTMWRLKNKIYIIFPLRLNGNFRINAHTSTIQITNNYSRIHSSIAVFQIIP